MELLKGAYADIASDESGGSNTKIKEEILTSSEYNLPGNYFPEEAARSCKGASEEEREFTVTLDGSGKKHVVRGRVCDSVLTALKATQNIRAWIDRKGMEEFYLLEKKQDLSVSINLGMPLKYVPEGSQFEMKRYKLKKNEETNQSWYRQYDGREECVLFYVWGTSSRMQTCGAQSRRIIRCPKVLEEYCLFCIFAPKEELASDAVCNDGRFLPMLEKKNWVLMEGSKCREKNFPVESLSGMTFEIQVMTETGATCSDGPREKQKRLPCKRQLKAFEKQQQDSEQGQLNAFEKQHHHHHYFHFEQGQLNTFKKQQQQQYLEQHVLDLYPKLKKQGKIIDKFLRDRQLQLKEQSVFEVYKTDFSKKINDSLSVKFVKTLANHSQSVGYISWNWGASGGCATCFVLTGRYILTCHHVVRDIVGEGIEEKDWGNRIKQSARVTFSYEEMHPSENNWFLFEDWFEISDKDLDFAVLKLEENESKNPLPPGLLQLFPPAPLDSPLFIIGHPSGETKSMDVCFLIDILDRSRECISRWTQGKEKECCSINMYNPKDFEAMTNPNMVTYDTSFLGGSSGSPIFDKRGQLVGLHAAGYLYKMKNEDCSVIEFGYLIQSILLKIESKFKSQYDAIIAPACLTGPGAREDISHVETSLNEEEMDCD